MIAKIMEKNKLFDRSKTGNKSCFRNETLQYLSFAVTADWKLPPNGEFECDFIYLLQSRGQVPLTEEQFSVFYEAFQTSPLSPAFKIRVNLGYKK